MAWIEFHLALWNHWKINRLKTILKIRYAEALGVVACLWTWAGNNSPKGDLAKFTDAEIDDAARWEGDKKVLKKALKDAELLEKNGRLHDWDKHGMSLIMSSRKRQKRYDKILRKTNVRLTSTLPTLPTNQPKERKEKLFFSPKEAERHFEAVWGRYPSRTGRKAAFRHFQATVRTAEELSAIGAALNCYLKSDRVCKGFIQNGSTWFNDWQSWLDHKDPSQIVLESREKQEMAAKDRESWQKQDREKREKAERLVYEADVEKLKSLPDEEFDKIKKRACERLDKNRMLSDSLKTEMLEPEMVAIMRELVQT